ncbi:MAG: DNA alkylation repair protein, partial [Acholeplasmatales bacterium]|nr:DNA alkylation repair protein [Acholeplasmatales bacterium]
MDNIILKIREELKQNIDLKYKSFQSKLIPNITESTILGVKTPILKAIAKKYASREDITLFLNDLPHQYFEENQIHSFIISLNKDFNETIKLVESFLPYINNWATCDQLNPKAFKSDERLILY